jgi:hypothetical protein
VYVSPEERAVIEQLADESWKDISKFVRHAATQSQAGVSSKVSRSLSLLTLVERFLHGQAEPGVYPGQIGEPNQFRGGGRGAADTPGTPTAGEALEHVRTVMKTLAPLLSSRSAHVAGGAPDRAGDTEGR